MDFNIIVVFGKSLKIMFMEKITKKSILLGNKRGRR